MFGYRGRSSSGPTCPDKALSTHAISVFALKGLRSRQKAPLAIARLCSRSSTRAVIMMTGDVAVVRVQALLELYSAQSRHLDVGDDALG